MLHEVGPSGEPVVVRKLGHKLKIIGEKVELRRQVGGCTCWADARNRTTLMSHLAVAYLDVLAVAYLDVL